jgi:hypothetical protein
MTRAEFLRAKSPKIPVLYQKHRSKGRKAEERNIPSVLGVDPAQPMATADQTGMDGHLPLLDAYGSGADRRGTRGRMR